MFDNIGGKIKGLAAFICVMGIIASLVGGLVIAASGTFKIGLLVILGGSLFSWIGSWFMYGFGQLIENSDKTEKNTKQILLKMNSQPSGDSTQTKKTTSAHQSGQVKYEEQHMRKCNSCGRMISSFPCRYCGNKSQKLTERRVCTNCGEKISDNPCPFCGYDDNGVEKKEKEPLI